MCSNVEYCQKFAAEPKEAHISGLSYNKILMQASKWVNYHSDQQLHV